MQIAIPKLEVKPTESSYNCWKSTKLKGISFAFMVDKSWCFIIWIYNFRTFNDNIVSDFFRSSNEPKWAAMLELKLTFLKLELAVWSTRGEIKKPLSFSDLIRSYQMS